MIEEKRCAGLTQGMEGNAMDYILYAAPEKSSFKNGESFSAHIRHWLIKSPEPPAREQLERLWSGFEESHAATHRRAREARGQIKHSHDIE
jgi:hypothetical protein